MAFGVAFGLWSAVLLTGSAEAKSAPEAREHRAERHFYGRERNMNRWRSGAWEKAAREGHEGWWWVVGDVWYLYPMKVYPHPDPYQEPLYILTPTQVLPTPELPSSEEIPVLQEEPPMPDEDFPPPAFTNKQGRTCREYQSSILIDGETKEAFGTACLQPDGSWRVVH